MQRRNKAYELVTTDTPASQRSARNGFNGLSRCSPAADSLFRCRRHQLRFPFPVGSGSPLGLGATRDTGTTRLNRPRQRRTSASGLQLTDPAGPAPSLPLAPDAAASTASCP